jgi:hypothetical protein
MLVYAMTGRLTREKTELMTVSFFAFSESYCFEVKNSKNAAVGSSSIKIKGSKTELMTA